MAGLVFPGQLLRLDRPRGHRGLHLPERRPVRLNLEPGVTVSTCSVERYQKMLRDDELAISVFQDVTTRLAEKLELDITCQRLDFDPRLSSYGQLRSHQADGRGDQAVPRPGQASRPQLYAAIPEEFRRRYEPAESQLFSAAKDAESRQRSRQQAAEDLLWVIERFANCADMTGRSTYKALVTIFSQQGEVSAGKVVVKAKTGGDCMQNPSDPTATYDAHKGQGYQVQIAETCSPENEVQLITVACRTVSWSPTAGRWCRCSISSQSRSCCQRRCWPTPSTAATRTCRRPRLAAWSWWRQSPAASRKSTPRP